MQIRKALQLFVLGLSATSVVDATFVSPRLARHERALQRRQDGGGDGGDSASEPTNRPTAPSTSETTTPTPTTSSTTVITTSTSTQPPDTSSSVTSPTPTTTPRPGDSASSSTSSTTTAPESNQSGEPTTHVQTITRTIVTTNPDGSQTTLTDQIVTTSTSQPLPNGSDNNNNGGSTMSDTTRKTVIGVVCGIGGAIVLAGLGFVAWRIWGKKKQQEEQDTLMDDYSAVGEKPDTIGSTSTRTPFQSTLESYHAPTQVNTASNF